MKKDFYQPLLPGQYYHLFNRAVGNEKLFYCHENYDYFLRRMRHHILPVAELYAYSLMPNHFHIMTRIRSAGKLKEYFEKQKGKPFNASKNDLSEFVMQQFSNWLSGYVKAINRRYERKGGLFIDYVKRTRPESKEDLCTVVGYIHRNAIHHGIEDRYGSWHFDSYRSVLQLQDSIVKSSTVMSWFGSPADFQLFHREFLEVDLAL